ncbi:type II secretion system protein N [Hydrocarboniclastica marina]|uniref:General secretion pathway protein GspC n=1 Tax=Hydrocarboniclastica marina TaxID=2259620 RepID=A0A4V1D8R2_9ALTE|nr:type II secretion system protein N [Hydrocarboniclastica marina]MAL99338.1 general secretion pathway protein GspC [Alteromonadaceae bacterium]QCF26080.1 general secretion pathway protein GspC [Hydrocarboniclastica marina]
MQDILYRAPRPLMLLLAAAALVATTWQIYHFWLNISAPYTPAVTSEPLVESRLPRPDVDLANISLFGNADNSGPVEVDTENLPETNLRLVLRGVGAIVVGTEESTRHLPSALIEGPNKETDYYVVGASLPGNAALKAVYADRIVLDRQGNLENLYFPEEFEAASFRTEETEPQTTASNSSAPNTQSAPRADNRRVDEARKAEIRSRLERLRERLRSNN